MAIDAHASDALARTTTRRGFKTFLSAAWIVGLPSIFWIALFEFSNYVLFFGITVETRVTVGLILIGLFSMVWALVSIMAHQNQETVDR